MKTANDEILLDKQGNPVEGVPASYSNVTEDGKVLFLDVERLKRKEQPEKPMWKNKPDGLGIKNFIVTHTSARGWNWPIVLKVFRKIVSWSVVLKLPETLRCKLYRRAMLFDPEDQSYSFGTAFPLKVDEDPEDSKAAMTEKEFLEGTGNTEPAPLVKPKIIEVNQDLFREAEKVTVPLDLVRKAIMEAKYIGGMKECLCRAGQDCKDYPHDLACLFLNLGGKVVVDHGMAVELTKEEALARVDKAAELGLTCQSLWVQVEQLIWGFKNSEMDSFLEICFCCPCCCVGMNLAKNSLRDIKKGFAPSGWTAVVNRNRCTGCQHCLDVYCPQDAIHFRKSDGKMVVDQEHCMGCGVCREHCPEGAISLKQTMPMRRDMLDYFREQARINIVPGKMFEK